jgi:hypothetical protein
MVCLSFRFHWSVLALSLLHQQLQGYPITLCGMFGSKSNHSSQLLLNDRVCTYKMKYETVILADDVIWDSLAINQKWMISFIYRQWI